MVSKVIHFEIPIDDDERASSFYGQAFGWRLQRFGPADYWTTEAGGGEGIDGALTRRSEETPSVTCYIEVDDIDRALDAIESAGGSRLDAPMPIPAMGWSAFFEDTEGNRLGLFQVDPEAPGNGADA